MHFSTLIYTLATMSSAGLAQYTLEDDYFASGDFYSMFSWWNTGDPTHGFVNYVDQGTAQGKSMANGSATYAQWGVDHQEVVSSGRDSIRLTSGKSYNDGLIILDVAHMPGGICGTWPAFWMVGPNWPHDGEIDIFEGVNDQTTNDMTLHTGPGCSISSNGGSSGTMKYTNCDSTNGDNSGCQIQSSDTNTYGAGFNANGGGVYATEITDSGISMWFFPRNSIPSNVQSDSPDPSTWGTPASVFELSCSMSSNFQQMQIVFDTTFCGDWAGNTWGDSSCSALASTCNDYVANNPSAFADAYWTVNALKVYSSSGNGYTGPTANSPAPSSSSSAIAAPTTTFATSAVAPTPTPTGSGPLGGSAFNPAPSTGSSGSSSGSGSGSSSSTGSGPLGGSIFNPNPSSSASDSTPSTSSGSGALGGSIFTPGAGSGTGDATQNAAAPGGNGSGSSSSSNNNSGSSSSSSAWSPSVGSNGIVTEHQSRRDARRARHLRQHRVRHARR